MPTIKPTPTPIAPSPSPSLTPAQLQYQFAESLYRGLEYYNAGIDKSRESMNAANISSWKNASERTLEAKALMEQAAVAFNDTKTFAVEPDWKEFTKAWNNISIYYAQCYDYQSQAYLERAYQDSRPTPNYVMVNYYIEKANEYNVLAKNEFERAKQLKSGISFLL